MPPKKRTRNEQQFDPHVFVSKNASLRYNSYNQKMVDILERGLDIPEPINEEIERRNWEKLCGQPDPAILPLVMEFYANAKENEEIDTVVVRGKQVCFGSTAINKFYELPDIPDDESHSFHDFLENHVDWEEVINDVCKSETNWKFCATSNEVSIFPTKQLAAFPRAWFYFISAKLMPASHLSSVHRNRAALIHAIINGYPIDVGKVINEAISYCIKDESLAFVCPSLITSLCKEAGVPWSIDEPLLLVKGAFNTKSFNSMKDSTSGFGTEMEYVQPPPPPRRQTVPQKQDQLEQMVKDHIAEFVVFKTDFLDHQRRVEALFEYQRQANEVLHQSLAQIAQKQEGNSRELPPLPPFPDR